MAEIKPLFGSSTPATITLASLAAGTAQQSSAWDWSSWLDILISFQLTAGAASVSPTGSVSFYVFGSTDGGTTRTGGAGATDAPITVIAQSELIFLGRSFLNVNNQVRREGPYSIAAVFGGTLPASGGVVVFNGTAANLAASGHLVTWQGVRNQVV